MGEEKDYRIELGYADSAGSSIFNKIGSIFAAPIKGIGQLGKGLGQLGKRAGENIKGGNVDTSLMTQGATGLVGGIGGIIGGLSGMGKAKRQRRKASQDFQRELSGLRGVDVSNPFARMRNPYTNLTVNKQQAEFQAQQGQQALTDILSQSRVAAGGSGVAALAQAMANQSTQMMQQASASIGEQESRNIFATAEGEMSRQMAIGQGEQAAQQLRAEKASVLTGYAADRLESANEVLEAKRKAVGTGIGNIIGGVANLSAAGLFADN